MVYGLIIAAGFSSRAKGYKMGFIINGKTVLEHAIETMLAFCDEIVVVAGYEHNKILPITQAYSRVNLVINEDYINGMYSSILKGLSSIVCDRLFILPGDMPNVHEETYEKLLSSNGRVCVPSFNYKGGHPVLIDGSVLLGKGYMEHTNLKSYIKSIGITYVDVLDQGILMDVDTQEDYMRIKGVMAYENN